MRAIRIHSFGGPEVLHLDHVEKPIPPQGDVLIRVVAASVNPVDYKIRRGGYPRVKSEDLPVTLGRDVCGVVEISAGPFTLGDEVYAHLDWNHGGYAEWALCSLAGVALKPKSLDMVTAAGVPLVATTAWQGLFDHGQLRAGQRVLIHGGSGGVGAYAVQFAREAKAEVIATASGDGLAAVKANGAHQVIDYKTEPFEDLVAPVDLVLDLVGGDTQSRSFTVLKRGGALISAVQPPDPKQAADNDVRIERYIASPNAQALQAFAALIDQGKLTTSLSKVYPLSEAATALSFLETNHPRGKVVLAVA